MPTNAENIKYIEERIETFIESAKTYRTLALNNAEYKAVGFKEKAVAYENVAAALTHVLYFVKNGTQHPDLGVALEQSADAGTVDIVEYVTAPPVELPPVVMPKQKLAAK